MTTGNTQPPSRSPRQAAIAGILGLPPDADGAALLGLRDPSPPDAEVIDALNQRLALVNTHPQGSTPLGDEARLALHAAAAGLLGSASPAAPARAGSAPHRSAARAGLPAAQVALEHDAVLALGLHGGWNPRTMRHLAKLTHARGLSNDDLAVALTRLARRPTPAASSTQRHHAAPSHREHDEPGQEQPQQAFPPAGGGAHDPPPAAASPAPSGDLALAAAMAVAVLLTLLAAAAVLIALPVMRAGVAQSPPEIATAPTPEPTPRSPQAQGPPDAQPDAPQAPPRGPLPDTRLDTVVTDLRLAADRRRTGDPSAGEVFARAVRTLADGWPALETDRRAAATTEIIDHVYLVRDRPQARGGVLDTLLAPLEPDADATIAARAWSAGLAARLTDEPELPAPVLERLRATLRNALGPDAASVRAFEPAAAIALRDALQTLLRTGNPDTDLDAWDRWIRAARGLAKADQTLGDRQVLAALARLLLEAPEPTDSELVFRLIRRLVVALPWRPGDASRQRLLAWFDDPTVSVADLHAITNALATATGAPGVDPTMVLPALASPAVRAQVADRYAKAWDSGQGLAHDEVAARWLAATATRLAATPPTQDLQAAQAAVVDARLSAAAALLWNGQPEQADLLLAALHDGLDAPGAQGTGNDAQTIHLNANSPPDDWSLRYLRERRPELKLELLDELARDGLSHAVQAELVVLEFLRGSPASVRSRAGDLVLAHAGTPLIAAAALEALPLPGSDRRRLELVETVTGVRLPEADGWELAARRLLVERLLELLSGRGELARIDSAADALADAYAQSLRARGGPDDSDDAPPELRAQLLFDLLRPRADRVVPPPDWPWTPADIDRRLAGRLRMAQGRVQRFAAFQVSLTELWLYTTAGERTAAAPSARQALDAMRDARRRAAGILQQVAAVERARLEAWNLRIDAITGKGPQ